jgi:hypothetical protein
MVEQTARGGVEQIAEGTQRAAGPPSGYAGRVDAIDAGFDGAVTFAEFIELSLQVCGHERREPVHR